MLVLSRKSGERIHIGDNVTLEVRRVSGNRVTLALHAPRDVRILRGELKEAAEAFEVTEVELPQDGPEVAVSTDSQADASGVVFVTASLAGAAAAV